MSREQIGKSHDWAVFIVAILFILGGIVVGLLGLVSLNGAGSGLLVLGIILFSVGVVIEGANRFALKAKTVLSIEAKEATRNKLGNVCSNCGARNPLGASFCGNCGQRIIGEKQVVREKEIVREKEVLVKIRCPYCNRLYDETLDVCPHCGGKR